MKIDDVIQTSLLYDFYGSLLTDRQREVMELYYGENLSLSEIAAEFSISRQGVHDALKNAGRALHEYEQKLGLVDKFQQSREAIGDIDERIEFKVGNLAMVVGGKHSGQTGKIKDIIKVKSSQPNRVIISGDKEFETIEEYVYMIGTDSPVITVTRR